MQLYEQGKSKYDAKDYAAAVELFREAAEKGNAKAKFRLGLCYQEGKGVGKDEARAALLFKEAVPELCKAAEQGDADAQILLGVCYQMGTGVAQDMAEAVKWWRKAAEQGDDQAQYNLGVSYAEGIGVAKDKAEAVRWFTKAAEQGYQPAFDYLKQFNQQEDDNGHHEVEDDIEEIW
jgi:TPR repeat protein